MFKYRIQHLLEKAASTCLWIAFALLKTNADIAFLTFLRRPQSQLQVLRGASKAWVYSDAAKTAYTHFKSFFRPFPWSFRVLWFSETTFDVRRVFGVTSALCLCVKDMCLGVFMSYPSSYHGALYSFKALTRPSLPNSRDISWYQNTIIGIGNITISAWAAWFCYLSHKEMIFFLSPSVLFLKSLAFPAARRWCWRTPLAQEPVMPLSTQEGEAAWCWQTPTSYSITVFGCISTSVKFHVTEAAC